MWYILILLNFKISFAPSVPLIHVLSTWQKPLLFHTTDEPLRILSRSFTLSVSLRMRVHGSLWVGVLR